jgi:hypothetical protein
MKRDYDIAQERRSIKASWNAFSWIMVTFAIVALAGWVVGFLLR